MQDESASNVIFGLAKLFSETFRIVPLHRATWCSPAARPATASTGAGCSRTATS
ncbi:hypothetical protein [Paenarthrobacter sp. NPDC091669]|uniref:hypothetical protein n=1 Tax=Paenarthrobacter sp. NPDC091669 TaxID=3364384 RepID=UPI003805E7DF